MGHLSGLWARMAWRHDVARGACVDTICPRLARESACRRQSRQESRQVSSRLSSAMRRRSCAGNALDHRRAGLAEWVSGQRFSRRCRALPDHDSRGLACHDAVPSSGAALPRPAATRPGPAHRSVMLLHSIGWLEAQLRRLPWQSARVRADSLCVLRVVTTDWRHGALPSPPRNAPCARASGCRTGTTAGMRGCTTVMRGL